MSAICSSNITAGFVDLATFDELEKYMYGGPHATAYFVRETTKATWFTQVPVVLSRASGQPGFDTEFSVSISRAGDYLLSTWLRLTTPALTARDAEDPEQSLRIRWTRNLMHNLIREACISFNDLTAARFDNYHLDFWSAFTVPAGKRTGYNNMIGNIDALTQPSTSLPATTLNLPLPFFYTRDSGVALPTAALPYNEMRITICTRRWEELLVVDVDSGPGPVARQAVSGDVKETPTLKDVQVWANYAIVSNDERQMMGCGARDMLIEQVQTGTRQTYLAGGDSRPRFDLRFSHAIKALFFGVRNTTVPSEWSNYTSHTPALTSDSVDFGGADMVDPIQATSLIYENTTRLSAMGSDYFSLVNPYYHAPSIPLETGYHMYSYSLDFVCLDPMGSTNYGKLTNVSIVPEASQAAQTGQSDDGQSYEFITTVVNNNVIRIAGGALGFPVL